MSKLTFCIGMATPARIEEEKSKDFRLYCHRILFRSQKGKENAPENLRTLCETCHKAPHERNSSSQGESQKQNMQLKLRLSNPKSRNPAGTL